MAPLRCSAYVGRASISLAEVSGPIGAF